MKTILTIALMLFLSITASAQQEKITFGISGGMNWSTLRGSDIDSLSTGGASKGSISAVIGITLDNKTTKHFGLKHELFYSRRLTTVEMNDAINPIFTSSLRRQYLDLFPASPTFYYKGFQLYAGPYLGILLNASIQRKDDDGNLYTDKTFFGSSESSGGYSQKMDAGIVMGLNYELPNGLNFGARCIRGFVPLIENANTQEEQWKIYNQSFFVTMGYKFQ
ncbi:PorT family protein [Flavobacterium sp. ZT3R18]|uniref:outer membrane beta-barrel protein n=1 Tax=Flavobacterium sp. ZT3R18 TaxID=2594429 RepID=UPI00117B5A6B|nr:outer membrane beta-barrel protein [Flavobacterium sp. ZT3R18]TRX37941.1 PorT family protein [Flavobacterium sp. ZT3R18]